MITTIAIRQTTKGVLDEIKEILSNLKIKSTRPYWDKAARMWLLQIRDKESIKLFEQKINFRRCNKG